MIAIEEVLLPHLDHEERELMPHVARLLTDAEWRSWDDSHVDDKSKRQLAFEGHWLLDNLEAEGRDVVLALVPPLVAFVLVNLMAGPYRRTRRTRRTLWSGTPAEAVSSLSLEESC